MSLPQNKNIYSVSQVNEYVKMLLDSNPVLNNIYIKGEISNFVNHYRTGHLYFSLKDEDGLVRAVMFNFDAQKLAFKPENGMKVIVSGRISSYVRDGQYQIYVKEMYTDGIGALYIAYEQLRSKLEAEGLFLTEHKKSLPKYPKAVGIITSATGAVIHDMCSVGYRRYPSVTFVLYGAVVQGANAAKTLVDGIKYFNDKKNVDLIVIGRGGGSLEDLWAFNDERLAREIYNSKIPVVSAVGHESDFTICDFVSDMRAPTPSAAMELCLPDHNEIRRNVVKLGQHCEDIMINAIQNKRDILNNYAVRPCFESAEGMIAPHRMRLDFLSTKLDSALNKKVESANAQMRTYSGKLEALSPLAVISRGYGLVSDSDGQILSKVKSLVVGQEISITLSDGQVDATVSKIIKKRGVKK